MKWLRTDANNFRMKRKCSVHCGSWIFMLGTLMLLMTVSYVSCSESDDIFDDGFNADDYADVDNVEWHHVKIVDGVLQPEDHPIIFYKEDIVNEDYVSADSAKEKRKNDTAPDSKIGGHRIRKYKEISRRHRNNRTNAEKYLAIKPEKTYFDILPQAPVVTAADDSNANDSRFDTSKIRVEIMSLADDVNVNVNENNENEYDSAAESKQLLNKRPKKYRRRQRRDATSEVEHKVTKRNPYYVNGNANNNLLQYLQSIYAASNQQQQGNRRYPVKGNYWNALSAPIDTTQTVSVVNRLGFEPDRVIWNIVPNRPARVLPPQFRDPGQNNIENTFKTTRRPQNQPRPTFAVPPLIRDPRPENADTSFLTTRRPALVVPPLIRDPRPENADTSFLTTRRPAFNVPPLIRDPRPENADTSFLTRRPPAQDRPGDGSNFNQGELPPQFPPAAAPAKERPRQSVSQCVWAIVSCCSRDNLAIRNDCFEAMNCGRAFWGLNPCADNIQEQALEYVENYLE